MHLVSHRAGYTIFHITKIRPCDIQIFLLVVKIENFQKIFFIYFSYFCSKHRLRAPWRGGSNESPQSMFWNKNKKNVQFCYIKVVYKGVYTTRTFYPDAFFLFLLHVTYDSTSSVDVSGDAKCFETSA